MNPLDLIDKYYPQDNELKHILLVHSRSVADKALWIAARHPELKLDETFLNEAAMLHDIGMPLPSIVWVRNLIFVTVIWVPIWCVRKVSHSMLWSVRGIPEPGFHWKKSLISNFLFRIVKCCR